MTTDIRLAFAHPEERAVASAMARRMADSGLMRLLLRAAGAAGAALD